jgi:hypothetical protein
MCFYYIFDSKTSYNHTKNSIEMSRHGFNTLYTLLMAFFQTNIEIENRQLDFTYCSVQFNYNQYYRNVHMHRTLIPLTLKIKLNLFVIIFHCHAVLISYRDINKKNILLCPNYIHVILNCIIFNCHWLLFKGSFGCKFFCFKP